MAKERVAQKRRNLIIATALVVVVIVVAIIMSISHNNDSSKTPATQVQTTPTEQSTQPATTNSGATSDTTSATETPKADPSSLSSIPIEPLGVNVFYTKGVPGFEYSVEKTADNTQYVEFTASALVGTKCTDDQGPFASIIKDPSSTEDQTTVSQTVKVGGDTYGLSLPTADCTSDPELLSQYQTAFKDGFSSLAAL